VKAKLEGGKQTTSRAEARAVLEAIKKASTPIWIISDCLNVAQRTQEIIRKVNICKEEESDDELIFAGREGNSDDEEKTKAKEEAKKEQKENRQRNKALDIKDDDKSDRASVAHPYKEEDKDSCQRTADKDEDIFWHIHNLVKDMPKNYIRITWMPAHLDEEKTRKRKKSSLRQVEKKRISAEIARPTNSPKAEQMTITSLAI
jgi:hypothetical protein